MWGPAGTNAWPGCLPKRATGGRKVRAHRPAAMPFWAGAAQIAWQQSGHYPPVSALGTPWFSGDIINRLLRDPHPEMGLMERPFAPDDGPIISCAFTGAGASRWEPRGCRSRSFRCHNVSVVPGSPPPRPSERRPSSSDFSESPWRVFNSLPLKLERTNKGFTFAGSC